MWDQEQQQSFDELKERLASAETLGDFDKNAHTKVIAGASPVGRFFDLEFTEPITTEKTNAQDFSHSWPSPFPKN